MTAWHISDKLPLTPCPTLFLFTSAVFFTVGEGTPHFLTWGSAMWLLWPTECDGKEMCLCWISGFKPRSLLCFHLLSGTTVIAWPSTHLGWPDSPSRKTRDTGSRATCSQAQTRPDQTSQPPCQLTDHEKTTWLLLQIDLLCVISNWYSLHFKMLCS